MPAFKRKDISDAMILQAIQQYEGVPNDTVISESLGKAKQFITRKNGRFDAAMEARGREYLSSLSDPEIAKKYSEGFTNSMPGYAREMIYERLHAMIARAIRECAGVPHSQSIGEASGIRSKRIPGLLDMRPELKLAMEQKARENIGRFSRDGIIDLSSKQGLFAGLPDYAQKAIWERLDAIIMDEIKKFEGVPTGRSIANALDKSGKSVRSRIEQNPQLGAELEKRGREYLTSLTDSKFVSRLRVMTAGKLPAYAKKIFYERLDSIIFRAIVAQEGTLSITALVRLSKVSYHTIERRLEENPELWTAFYAKMGLTADQAIELALERDEQNNSVNKVLSERLGNLYAFREMAGIIRCFGHLLNGKTLEVSLYPEPMKKAAEELGIAIDVFHQDMRSFRRGESPSLESAQSAVLQGIHRLGPKQLTRLFESLHSTLDEGTKIIATHSSNYRPGEAFISALQQNGFEVKDSGILLIEPPSRDSLLACGAPEADLARISRKMQGESRLLFITAIKKSGSSEIPQLEKLHEPEGESRIMPNGETIDIPKGAVREINARFLFEEMAILPSAPFMVDVREGEKKTAVLGFDMDPHRPGKVEFGVYPGAPAEDFKRIARRLATKMESRNALGIKPGRETRVQMGQLRKLMA